MCTLSQKDAVNEYFVHTDSPVDVALLVEQLAEKKAMIQKLQKNATNQEARFHTAYAHVLAAIDSLECFDNPDYAPIITVLKQYRNAMPKDLEETTLREKREIKTRMAPIVRR
jgi:predicted transcriptional regulator